MVEEIHAAFIGGADDLGGFFFGQIGHSHAALDNCRDVLRAVGNVEHLHGVPSLECF